MSSTATPGSAPKSMSSRLLTMKFMQRAAASSPTTPSPSTPEEPPSKRRKKDADSPLAPRINVDELADLRAVQAALAGEEAKRQAALERAGTEAGDTRWVLSFEDQSSSTAAPNLAIRVVQAGYANLDIPPTTKSTSEDSSWEEKPIMVGRRSFGKFNKVLEKQQKGSLMDDSSSSDSEDDDEESEESESVSNDPTSDLIKASRQEAAERAKAERKAKKKAEKAQSLEMAKQRKKKEVNLNGLSSLSGRQQPLSAVKCHTCQGPHFKKDCPSKRRLDGPDRGPSKKARISK